jgi:glycosyltransferase involved in cell wall biosynthesis
VRLAVYTDYPYSRREGEVRADRSFALFVAGLAPKFERLVALGRVDPTGAAAKYAIGGGVEFVALPYYPSLTKPLAVLAAMARSLRTYWRVLGGVDAIWLLGPHPVAVLFALIALARRKRVVLGVRQDMVPYVRARHRARPGFVVLAAILEGAYRALGRVCPVIVVGPELARNYRRSRAVLDIAVSLVPSAEVVPVESALRRRYDGTLELLSVGRLEAEKNPLLLAEILAALNRDAGNWRLTVCGEGPMRTELEARLRELGVAERADLRGYLPNDQGLVELYRSSHAFLHVSWTEGLPQVLLEAFASGLPVVATDVGGVGEAVGPAAALVPPGDPDRAVAALVRIAGDPPLRERLVRAGNEYAQRHTAEAESARVVRFLRGEDY